jgi:hypothetical protein
VELSAAMREFLVWVAFVPRTEADVLEAWQSHCPRFTVWEDAQDAGLVVLRPTRSMAYGSAWVELSPRGVAALAASDPHTSRDVNAPPSTGTGLGIETESAA